MGFYYQQLRRYYDLFPPDQIRVYIYRGFRLDPDGVLQDLFRYVGVDDAFRVDRSERHNSTDRTAVRAVLTTAVRTQLIEAFRPDILQLEDLLQRDLSHWLAIPPTVGPPTETGEQED